MGIRRAVAACCLVVTVASGRVSAQERQREPVAKEPDAPANAKRLEPGPAPDDGIETLVVDAESGEPVANALVTWFEKHEGFFARVLPEGQLEQERIEHGQTVATDAKGLTKIGRIATGDLIVASADGRYDARRWNRANPSPLRLQLKRTRRIDVAVVDDQGRPMAGAPLSLAANPGSQGPVNSWQTSTGPDGKASFAPLDLFLDFELRTPHELHLRVDAPLGEAADAFARVLDDRKLPREPVTFTLPPTGTLRVDVVDDHGAPVTGDHYLTVRTAPAGAPDAAFDAATETQSGSEWFCFDERAHYEIRCVVLHRRVQVAFDDDGMHSTKRSFDGPTKPGESVDVKLVLDPKKRLEVLATVVGTGDRPIADAPLTLRLIGPDRAMPEADLAGVAHFTPEERRVPLEATSDASGRVKWSLEEDWNVGDLDDLERRIERIELEQTGPTGVVAVARGAFPAANAARVHDLGTVKLVPTPRFTSGRVVDDAGQTVARARVTVTAKLRPRPGAPMVIGNSGSERYDQSFAGRCAADGSFVLFALPIPDADFQIQATPPDRAANADAESEYERFGGQRVAVRAGDRDVELTLSRVGTIAGTIVGDAEEIARFGYCLELQPTVSGYSSQAGGIGGSEFSLEGIPVGSANLKITDAGGHLVARVADIAVRAGEVTRLPPIAFAEARHVLVLAIRDEAGQPVASGWVARSPPADRPDPFEMMRKMLPMVAPEGSGIDLDDLPFDQIRMPSITPFRDGAITLRSNERFRALAVGAPRCGSVMLHDVEGEQAVTLRPAPKVALVLDLEGELQKDRTIAASLVPSSDDDEWYRFGPGSFGGPGLDVDESERLKPVALAAASPVTVAVRATGTARVRLSLATEQAAGILGIPLHGEPRTVTITESRDLQVFHVRVSADALKAATPAGERR